MIEHPAGIRYSELSPAQQQLMLQLLGLYVHRYTKLFADNMLKQIQAAGLENLWFTWAGYTEHVLGKPYYYRLQGPTIIIEYDNSQNNANHIHTVIRDLKMIWWRYAAGALPGKPLTYPFQLPLKGKGPTPRPLFSESL